MKIMRAIAWILPMALLALAGPAFAGGQGGAGGDGDPPFGLNVGDENSKGAFAGPAHLELRDATVGQPSSIPPVPPTARYLRLTSRIGDGEFLNLIYTDWECADADQPPLGFGSLCICEDSTCATKVIDASASQGIQALAVALIIQEVVGAFALGDAELEVTKLKKYVQDLNPVVDVDGVLSYNIFVDVGLDTVNTNPAP